jgi:hypothetical protein
MFLEYDVMRANLKVSVNRNNPYKTISVTGIYTSKQDSKFSQW